VHKLLLLYEGRETIDEGKPFDYHYNLKTMSPSQELAALYDEMEEELRRLGVPMC